MSTALRGRETATQHLARITETWLWPEFKCDTESRNALFLITTFLSLCGVMQSRKEETKVVVGIFQQDWGTEWLWTEKDIAMHIPH